MEHLGYAAITETPCVFIDVQRGGPSTGLPTLPAQADMMQVKWGSHGDYEIIALCPSSPQECFDLTVRAFNLAEEWRVPVFLMMDEVVGHMTERVVIPEASAIEITERRWTKKAVGDYRPFDAGADRVPDMTKAGEGHRIHVTGLTHDERGYPALTPKPQDKLIRRLSGKIRDAADQLTDIREEQCEGADVIVVSYGITSRVASAAVQQARDQGLKVGHARLVVAWPFPEHRIKALASQCRAMVVPELNLGQMVHEVRKSVEGLVPIYLVDHAGGTVHEPQVILDRILEAAR
jgi:2-oxoglutarate/2-oxoacid ferredoxin oxidoreductase subunit alpha